MKDSRPLSILCLGGRAYPVRHYPIAVRLRDRKGHAILCIALNPQSGDFSGAILEVPFKALLHVANVLVKQKMAHRCMVHVKPILIIRLKINGVGRLVTIASCSNKHKSKPLWKWLTPNAWRIGKHSSRINLINPIRTRNVT